tara:strand:- start:979 stop:2202 length:1224 start_codon:yes stop_codon:yes gene_type:complete
MGYYDLPEEGLEAIKEHALSNYLPFNGGFRQHYQIRNFGRNKKPKGKVRFYAVEYRPPNIVLEKAPIFLENEKTFYEFDQGLKEKRKMNIWKGDDDPEQRRINDEIKFYYDRIKFYKWGTERGFDFYGYKKWKDSKELQKIKAIPYKKMKKKDWEERERLEKIEYKKDISLHHTLAYDYPTQSFFKIGLSKTKAETRGYYGLDKEFKKSNPNPYKTIFIDRDLTDLYKKVHPADLEGFIYFHLFYKYWKDKLFYYSANKINLSYNNPSHQQIKFFGYTESFLFENVEDKLEIINNAFDLIEKSTRRQISAMVNKMINFDEWWNKIYRMKTRFPYEFNFDEGTTQDLAFYGDSSRTYGGYLAEIGFYEKWIPKDSNHIKELFDKRLEEFILPETKHLPEINNLKLHYD